MQIHLRAAVILSSLVLLSAIPADVLAADVPKYLLPSQQPTLPEGVERGPRVIENPNPSTTDKTGATEVKDPNPATIESVKESTAPKRIVSPGISPNEKYRVKAAKERKTIALALGGGGARGAAHIGILRVFEQEGIPIDYIVGNSMGSIVGGLYSSGVDLSALEQMGLKGGLSNNYLPSPVMRVLLMPISKLFQPLRKKQLAGLSDGMSFERYLEKLIPEGKNDFAKTRIPFSAVATNLKDGKAYRISEGKLSTGIRASSTLSPLLRPVKIDDKIYVDGGIRANLPASSAKDTGADVVVAVLVDDPLHEQTDKDFRTFKGITRRLADVVMSVTDEHQLQFADITINPDVSGIPMLSNKPEEVERAVRAGEAAARKAIPAIRKALKLPEGSELVGAGEGGTR